MGAYSRRLCICVLSAIPVGACLSDVEYLRNGQKTDNGGESGSESGTKNGGSGGNGGVFAVGAMDGGGKGGMAGTMTEDGGMPPEGGTGGTQVGKMPCEGIYPLFTFDEPNVVVNLNTGPKSQWSKGPYDSTNILTGDLDKSTNPPMNPNNLANKSLLLVDANAGNPDKAMSFSIPINPAVTKTQVVNVLYVFALYGEKGAPVDMSRASLSVDVKLGAAPHANCKMLVTPWTTGTDAAATIFNHVDGTAVTVTASKWTVVKMDLSKSNPATAVNQYGFVMKTTCSKVEPMGDGGAAGADAGGADGGGTGGTGGTSGGGSGGSGGSGAYSGPPTVVLFDNLETTCD
jgi:hypothetical protein